MVILAFLFTARTQNVSAIEFPQQSDWHADIKCAHCKQNFHKQVRFNKFDEVETTKNYGSANFGATCKNCERKSYIKIDEKSTYKVQPNENGMIKEIIAIVQCRGCEIIKVDLGNSFSVKVAQSSIVYQNADFTDLWCEVDEQTNLLAQVQDPKIQIIPQK